MEAILLLDIGFVLEIQRSYLNQGFINDINYDHIKWIREGA